MDATIFTEIIKNTLVVVGAASMLNITLLIIIYMIGVALMNQRVTTWAKTEIIDVIIFVAIILIFLEILPGLYDAGIYNNAQKYFEESLKAINEIINMARYHLAAFYILESRYMSNCDAGQSSLPPPFNFVISNCFFGMSGSGTSPFAGIGFVSQGFYGLLQMAVIAKLMLLVNYEIMVVSLSIFPLILLPTGIVLRSIPFLKKIGSLFFSIAFVFMFIFPLLFAIQAEYVKGIYDKMKQFTGVDPGSFEYQKIARIEKRFASTQFSMPFVNPAGALPEESINKDKLFKELFEQGALDYQKFPTTLAYGAITFIFSILMPNLALVASIAALYSINRILAVQVDFMRLGSLL